MRRSISSATKRFQQTTTLLLFRNHSSCASHGKPCTHFETTVTTTPPPLSSSSKPPIEKVSLHATTFYKRPLPKELIPFASTDGKKIFKEAMEEGYMEGYFKLAEQYQTQSEPSYCGLGTLTMVLNSLDLDPSRKWKEHAVWRWFDEQMLFQNSCCIPLETVKTEGINLQQFWCLAKCNGVDIEMYRYDQQNRCSEEQFRNHIKESTKTGSFYVVSSFSRKFLGQTGDGHFSPIGGYNEEKDLVLLMDVARFKYPTYWLPLKQLYQSMGEIDQSTGRSRGYFVIKKLDSHQSEKMKGQSLFSKLFLSSSISWRHLVFQFMNELEKILHQKKEIITFKELISHIFVNFSHKVETTLQSYSEILETESHSCEEHKVSLEHLLTEIQKLPLFSLVKECNQQYMKDQSTCEHCNGMMRFLQSSKANELCTLLLLTLPIGTVESKEKFAPYLNDTIINEWKQMRKLETNVSDPFRDEIAKLRYYLIQLCDHCGTQCEKDLEEDFSNYCNLKQETRNSCSKHGHL